MSYLEDKEKRLLFSALSREKKVCEKVDKECCREPYETSLKSIVERLEYKFYYDRFEKEIYKKAIDDFVEKLDNHTFVEKLETNYSNSVSFMREIRKMAEQLKNGRS